MKEMETREERDVRLGVEIPKIKEFVRTALTKTDPNRTDPDRFFRSCKALAPYLANEGVKVSKIRALAFADALILVDLLDMINSTFGEETFGLGNFENKYSHIDHVGAFFLASLESQIACK